MLKKITSYEQQSAIQAGHKLAQYTGKELIAEDELRETHPESFTFYQVESFDGTTVCLMPESERRPAEGEYIMANQLKVPFREMITTGQWWIP